MQDRFTSQQVIALTGITPRQLQWWNERGVVKPEREGHRRLYSMNQLTEVTVICELRRKGFALQGVRKVMRFLQRDGKSLAEIVARNSDVDLLTDGNSHCQQLIPEEMKPGKNFVLENSGKRGEKEDPYWAVLACPSCGMLGLITRRQINGLVPVICGSEKCSAQFFIRESEVVVRKPF